MSEPRTFAVRAWLRWTMYGTGAFFLLPGIGLPALLILSAVQGKLTTVDGSLLFAFVPGIIAGVCLNIGRQMRLEVHDDKIVAYLLGKKVIPFADIAELEFKKASDGNKSALAAAAPDILHYTLKNGVKGVLPAKNVVDSDGFMALVREKTGRELAPA